MKRKNKTKVKIKQSVIDYLFSKTARMEKILDDTIRRLGGDPDKYTNNPVQNRR